MALSMRWSLAESDDHVMRRPAHGDKGIPLDPNPWVRGHKRILMPAGPWVRWAADLGAGVATLFGAAEEAHIISLAGFQISFVACVS